MKMAAVKKGATAPDAPDEQALPRPMPCNQCGVAYTACVAAADVHLSKARGRPLPHFGLLRAAIEAEHTTNHPTVRFETDGDTVTSLT